MRGKRVTWGLVASAGVLLLALVGVGGWLWSRKGEHKPPEGPVAAVNGTAAGNPEQAKPKPDPNAAAKEELAAARRRSRQNLEDVARALLNYHDTCNHFPPAVVYSPQGRPLYSWRVLILPYLDEADLYKQFKLDEPWDSPHNKPLLAKMPAVYAPVRGKAEPNTTYYQAFVSPKAAFEGTRPDLPPGAFMPPGALYIPRGRGIVEFADGTSNTLLIAEGADPVPWTKPADLAFDADKPPPRLGGLFGDGFHAAFADGKVFFIPQPVDHKTLRAFITLREGEDVVRDDVLREEPPADRKPIEGKEVGRRIEQLRSEDAAERLEAVAVLAEVVAGGPPKEANPEVEAATEALAVAVGDFDGRVRQQASKALRGLGPRAAAPALLKAIRQANDFGWEQIARELHDLGDEAQPALLAGLDDDDYEVRATAAHVLTKCVTRKVNRPEDVPPWPEALSRRRERLEEARFLEPTSPEALEGILTLLEALHEKADPPQDGFFHTHAAAALGRMGPAARVAFPDLLYPRLQGPFARARNGDDAAAAALVREAPQALAAAAEIVFPRGPDAGAVPGQVPLDPKAVPALVALLDRPRGPHAAAARALAEIGPAASPAVSALVPRLSGREPGVRAEAARALGSIGPGAAAAVPALERLLTQRSEEVRRPEAGAAREFLNSLVASTVAHAGGRLNPWQTGWMVEVFMAAQAGQAWAAPPPAPERWRFEAARALVRIDPARRAAALPILERSLKSDEPGLAVEAAFFLLDLDPSREDAARTLLAGCAALGARPHPFAIGFAVGAENPPGLAAFSLGEGLQATLAHIGRLSPEARKNLLATGAPLLEAPDPMKRRAAALVLARLDPARALPVLREMVKAGGPEQAAATRLLAEMGPRAKDAFADLCEALWKKKEDRAGWGGYLGDSPLPLALVKIDPDAAAPFLIRLWQGKPAKEDHPKQPAGGAGEDPFVALSTTMVRQQALEALATLGPKAKAAIPAALADLKSPDFWVQGPAARLLAKIGPPAVQPLVERTQDPDAVLRGRAARVLGNMGPDARPALPALLKLREDSDAAVRQEAVAALGEVDPRDRAVAAALREAVQDPEARVRRRAARALGGLGAEALPALEPALVDADADVRRGAAGALAHIGVPAVPALRAALGNKDADVRRLAVLGLGNAGPQTEGTVAGLIEAVKDRDPLVRRLALSFLDRPGGQIQAVVPVLAAAASDPERQVRWTAAFVLECLGADAADAVPALSKALEDPAVEVRRRAVGALREIGPAARPALPALKGLFRGPYPRRVRTEQDEALVTDVVAALLRLDPDPATTLAEALRSRDEMPSAAAAEGLVRLGPKAVPTLLALTREHNLDARLRGIQCLGAIGEPVETVVPALESLLKDSNDLIRTAAARALGDVGPAAKAAVPALRALAAEGDPRIREAARAALDRID